MANESSDTTQLVLNRLEGRVHPQAKAQAEALATRLGFFHRPLEVPDVFADGGFDVVMGNPPLHGRLED